MNTTEHVYEMRKTLSKLLIDLYSQQFSLGKFGSSAEFCNLWDALLDAVDKLEDRPRKPLRIMELYCAQYHPESLG